MPLTPSWNIYKLSLGHTSALKLFCVASAALRLRRIRLQDCLQSNQSDTLPHELKELSRIVEFRRQHSVVYRGKWYKCTMAMQSEVFKKAIVDVGMVRLMKINPRPRMFWFACTRRYDVTRHHIYFKYKSQILSSDLVLNCRFASTFRSDCMIESSKEERHFFHMKPNQWRKRVNRLHFDP